MWTREITVKSAVIFVDISPENTGFGVNRPVKRAVLQGFFGGNVEILLKILVVVFQRGLDGMAKPTAFDSWAVFPTDLAGSGGTHVVEWPGNFAEAGFLGDPGERRADVRLGVTVKVDDEFLAL